MGADRRQRSTEEWLGGGRRHQEQGGRLHYMSTGGEMQRVERQSYRAQEGGGDSSTQDWMRFPAQKRAADAAGAT